MPQPVCWLCQPNLSMILIFGFHPKAEGEVVSTYIANDVSITQFDSECLGRIDSRIHAGQDEVLLRRWKGEVTLGET